MMDISAAGALIAGLLSFLSPCILPIVPFYLSYLAGVGMNQISADAPITGAVKRRAVISSLFFASGVIAIFVAMGATANAVGHLVRYGERQGAAREKTPVGQPTRGSGNGRIQQLHAVDPTASASFADRPRTRGATSSAARQIAKLAHHGKPNPIGSRPPAMATVATVMA